MLPVPGRPKRPLLKPPVQRPGKRSTPDPGKAMSLKSSNAAARENGGAEGDRTPDLGIANAALSQLSYCPLSGVAGF